ncbi:MAG: hypothetical protein ACLFNI_07155 [Natronomonas sp.]
MYEIYCESCARIGFHPSRVAAESRAETHADETGHNCSIRVMEDV